MNICFFSFEYISKTRGGTERVTDMLAYAFEAKGHNVYLISVCPPIEKDTVSPNRYVLPNTEIHSDINVEFVNKFLHEKKIDVIINQAVPKEVLTLILKAHDSVPIIACIHTHPLISIKSITDFWDRKRINNKWKFRFLFPFIYLAFQHFKRSAKKSTKEYLSFFQENCDVIVLLSNKYKTSVVDVLKNKKIHNLYAIPNPKDVNVATTDLKEKTIIFIGRIEFQKRIDRLLLIWEKIYKKHADWKLQIIGNGSDKNYFIQFAQKLGLKNVEFIGNTSPEEYYKRASIICMTSTHEGLPMVLLEALQYNVVPVAFNSFESITDIIVNKENGFLVKPFSINKYAKTLDKLMSDAEYLKSVQIKIQKKQEMDLFNKNHIVEQWEKLFEKIINRNI